MFLSFYLREFNYYICLRLRFLGLKVFYTIKVINRRSYDFLSDVQNYPFMGSLYTLNPFLNLFACFPEGF